MDEHTRTLNPKKVTAIRNAPAAVLVNVKEMSRMVDQATDTDAIDALHASFASERKIAEDLLELLEDAEEVVVHLPD